MEKLRVGILGADSRQARIIISYYETLSNRFEFYLQFKNKSNFDEAGIFDVLWVFDDYSSLRLFEKNIIKVLVEYHPLLCILAARIKPFTTQRIQNKLKLMNLGNIKVVYSPIFCSGLLIRDWEKYIHAFPMLIGYDDKSSFKLAQIHLNEIGFKCYSVTPSVNLEISKLLIDYSYLMYNNWEQEKKKIIRRIELKNQNKLSEAVNDIFQLHNIALIEVGRQDLRLPSLKPWTFSLEDLKRFLAISPIKLKATKMILKSNRLQTKMSLWKYRKAQIKYLYKFLLFYYNRIKGRIKLFNFKKKKNANKLSNNIRS